MGANSSILRTYTSPNVMCIKVCNNQLPCITTYFYYDLVNSNWVLRS